MAKRKPNRLQRLTGLDRPLAPLLYFVVGIITCVVAYVGKDSATIGIVGGLDFGLGVSVIVADKAKVRHRKLVQLHDKAVDKIYQELEKELKAMSNTAAQPQPSPARPNYQVIDPNNER